MTQQAPPAKPADGAAAPATEPAPKPAEAPKAPPKPQPTAERLHDLAVRKQQEIAARRARAGEATELRQKLAAQDVEIARLRRVDEEFGQFRNLAQTDRVAAAKRLGLSAKEIGEAIIEDGSPQGQIRALQSQLETQRQVTEKALAELRAANQQSAQQTAYERERGALLSAYREMAPQLEALSDVADGDTDAVEREVLGTFLLVQHHKDPRVRASAGSYTYKELLEATNARLEDLAERRLTAKQKRASSGSSAASDGQGGKAKSPSKSTKQSKTLSNAMAGDGASSWKPANWDKLTDAQQNRILADRLNAGLPLD